ncbi:hypothetical protein [Actinacidiphila glaucinigra]|uniref:hypothetical protein n=1 Tax=Actinacidiphila glaucinigra TaxID=235986 RepID=UPI0036E733E1
MSDGIGPWVTTAATSTPLPRGQRILAELREGRLEPVPGLELNSDTPLDAWHLAWAQQHVATRG